MKRERADFQPLVPLAAPTKVPKKDEIASAAPCPGRVLGKYRLWEMGLAANAHRKKDAETDLRQIRFAMASRSQLTTLRSGARATHPIRTSPQ